LTVDCGIGEKTSWVALSFAIGAIEKLDGIDFFCRAPGRTGKNGPAKAGLPPDPSTKAVRTGGNEAEGRA